jgi:hypothetical protein
MLNKVIVQGYVAGGFFYKNGDSYFRLGSYRDPQRPQRRKQVTDGSYRDEPDYVSCRLPVSTFTTPMALVKGMEVRVEGYLEHCYHDEKLGEFIKRAKGPVRMLSVSNDLQNTVLLERVSTEIVVEEFTLIAMPKNAQDNKLQFHKVDDNGMPKPANGKGGAPAGSKKPKQKQNPPAAKNVTTNAGGSGQKQSNDVPLPVPAPSVQA